MVLHHGFPSRFSIMVFHHGFTSWFSIMVFYRGEFRQGSTGGIGTQGHDPNCNRTGREISSSCSHLLAGTAKVPAFFILGLAPRVAKITEELQAEQAETYEMLSKFCGFAIASRLSKTIWNSLK